jgi:hypothetical protein
MRRLIAITAFALSLAVPLWAQHGGGHGGGGGGHGGFGGGHAGGFGGHTGGFGGHAGGFGGGHASGGMRASPGFSRGFTRGPSFSRTFSQRNFSRGPFLHDGFRGNRFGNRGNRFGNRGFRNFGLRNCWGYGCWGYGYPWWGYYDPWWWWDSDSGSDDSYQQDLANANAMNEQSLEEQQMLRQEEAEGDRDLYARSTPAPSQPEGAPVMPATVLVFRDQHKREIQNYAIVGQTLWNFAPQRTEKIPLADLDLAATVKANDERGVSFRLPSAGEGQ